MGGGGLMWGEQQNKFCDENKKLDAQITAGGNYWQQKMDKFSLKFESAAGLQKQEPEISQNSASGE